MNVTTQNWRITANATGYPAVLPDEDAEREEETTVDALMGKEEDTDTFLSSLEALNSQKSDGSDNFKMKSSKPDDSVGQLAAQLARAETRMDVQQVLSKASRALLNLKMSSVASEGKDQKKIAQMIRRMEKLIKRINKKLKHLGKEEQLDLRRRRAEKQNDTQKESLIRNELKTRRSRRRKEERNYALKEMAQDGKNSTQELVSGLSGAIQGGTSLDAAMMGDLGSMGMDAGAMADFGGIDVMA